MPSDLHFAELADDEVQIFEASARSSGYVWETLADSLPSLSHPLEDILLQEG